MSRSSRRFRSTFGPSLPEDDASFRTAAWKFGKAAIPVDVSPYFSSIVEALRAASELHPERGITLIGERAGRPDVHKTFGEVLLAAERLATGIRTLGVRAGDRVMLIFPTGFDFVEAFLGVQLLGAIPVPVYPPSGLRLEAGMERLNHVARQSGARVCLTWDELLPVLGDLVFGAPQLEAIRAIESLRDGDPIDESVDVRSDDIAFIQYTSGSTGHPKGVVLTHDNVMCNLHSIGQALEVSQSDRVASWCPLYHDMGLIGALFFAMYWCLPMVLMSPLVFLRAPHRWLWAIHDHRCTLSPAPNFGYALAVRKVTPAQREGLDLSCWRWAGNGAEQVSVETVRTFHEVYAPHGLAPHVVRPIYGLAEGSVAITFSELGRPLHVKVVEREALANGEVVPIPSGPRAMHIVGVGEAIPGQMIMVVDERGQPVGDGVVGHVLAGGRSIMRGYFRDATATRQAVRDGFLWTGDLGFLSDGELFITGRVKDLIIVRGKNYYADDLERVVEQLPDVRGGGCVAFGVYDEEECVDKVVVVCESKLVSDEERQELAVRVGDAVAEGCGLLVDEVVVLAPGTLPKTSSGKRQRLRTRERFLQGTLERPRRTHMEVGWVYVRSKFGYLLMKGRNLLGRYRDWDAPEA